jgi:hypothetical protein
MSTHAATASKPSIEALCAELCAHWGDGHVLAPASGTQGVQLRTPDQGLIDVQIHGDELEFRAMRWPNVHEHGFKRSFSRVLSARVSTSREPEAIARDLQRRLLQPYAAALSEARRQASEYRRLIADICACLDRVGLDAADRHVLGRRLQAHKPHGALDHNGTRLPTTSVTTVAVREDDSAVGAVEVRGLSLAEVEAVHDFVAELTARRRPVLRLAS